MMMSTKTAWGENPALSYRNLRAIIGYVGLTLPAVLLLAGLVDGHIESSLSAYYYTKVGNVFTGALCVIGVFLLAYRLASWAIDNIATTLAPQRFTSWLLAAFATLALLLASIGLYGVVAHTVALRTSELSIRLALGASPARVARSVLTESCVLAVSGVVIGSIAALMMGRAIAGHRRRESAGNRLEASHTHERPQAHSREAPAPAGLLDTPRHAGRDLR